MSNHLPYNPWEVSYSQPALYIPQKPTIIRFNPSYRSCSPSTFPLFPLLPAELRVRIWSLAAPHKRVVEIRSWGSGQYAPVRYSVHPHYLPAIFHVCKESRAEARRVYKQVGIGVSASTRVKGRRYVDWKYHPANPNSTRRATIGNESLPLATPHPPAYVYLSPEHDIIYIGPEFQAHHLPKFLTAIGEGNELKGLRYLALDYKFWIGGARGDALQQALWSLKGAENLSEIIVIPDDEVRCLEDRWYYGKHDITMFQPDMRGVSAPLQVRVQTFVDNLETWFEGVWNDQKSSHGQTQNYLGNNARENNKRDRITTETAMPKPPKVSIMSIKRNGTIMREHTVGLSDIQNSLGDMGIWKTWSPPANS
jgi:hypothetical protein